MIRFGFWQIVLIAWGAPVGQGGSSAGLSWCPSLAGYACMWVMGGKAPAYVYARPSERSATVGVAVRW